MFCQFNLFSILIQKRFAYLTVIIELKKSYVVIKMLQLTWHSLLMNLKRCFYCKNMLCDELFYKRYGNSSFSSSDSSPELGGVSSWGSPKSKYSSFAVMLKILSKSNRIKSFLVNETCFCTLSL